MIRRIIEDYETKLKPVVTGKAQGGMRAEAEGERVHDVMLTSPSPS